MLAQAWLEELVGACCCFWGHPGPTLHGRPGEGRAPGPGYASRCLGHTPLLNSNPALPCVHPPPTQGVSYLGQHDEFVMSGSDCGHIYVWDADTGQALAVLKVGWVRGWAQAQAQGGQRALQRGPACASS